MRVPSAAIFAGRTKYASVKVSLLDLLDRQTEGCGVDAVCDVRGMSARWGHRAELLSSSGIADRSILPDRARGRAVRASASPRVMTISVHATAGVSASFATDVACS